MHVHVCICMPMCEIVNKLYKNKEHEVTFFLSNEFGSSIKRLDLD